LIRAIWSFWSAPFEAYQQPVWVSPRHHLFSWVLTFELARRHYSETVLVTDDRGKALLADALRLPFSAVDTSLNALAGRDPCWWALGKLYAYATQSRPFVHIDSDVYFGVLCRMRLSQHPYFLKTLSVSNSVRVGIALTVGTPR
jgi:hypothetical protein